jgi:large repetitive protein
VPSAATIDKKSVDVDLSQWIANPSGTAKELQVGIDPSAQDHAHVKGGKDSTTVTVELTDEARSVPYTVTNTTYHITSTAFVQVPAYGVFAPTLRPKAPPIKVNAKRSVTINIADYVRVGAGKTAYVDKDTISATKSANSDYFVNDQTLKFTAPRDYAGPASITFTATDGKHNDKVDKNGSKQAKIINSAVITLPITVVGRNVPPPTFSAPTINVAAGEDAKTVDLKALTHAPGDLDTDEMDYTYSGGEVSGPITTHLTAGGKLTVEASTDAPIGSVTSIPISIKYSNGTVNAGLTAQVSQSTRPLAQIQPIRKQIKAGSSETVNVLDGAFNPFPGKALTVTDCKADDSAKLKVECGKSGSITINASEDIGASSNTVVVNVQDATKTRERQVSGTITLSVIDKPAAPLLAPYSSAKPQDGMITLSWTPGTANGSPITDYQVDWGSGSKSCGAVTSCEIGSLTNGKTYTFTVKARKGVGWSKASNSASGMPDKVPPAPTEVKVKAGYKAVTVSWNMPPYDGSPVKDYRISINGGGFTSTGNTATSKTITLDNSQITDGTSVSASVMAENGAGTGLPSGTVSDTPWGDPDQPGVSLNQNGEMMTVTVSKPSNMRNAGCRSFTLSGDVSGSLACPEGGSKQFVIPEAKYGGSVDVTATFVPSKPDSASSSSQASKRVDYAIPAPTNVRLTGPDAGGNCRLTWSGQGHYDGFIVDGQPFGKQTNRMDYQITPWQSCGSKTVQQTLKGHTGAGATASNQNVYTKQANIDRNITVQWRDHDHVVLSGGGVQNWNVGVVQLHVWSGSDQKLYAWKSDGVYDVSDLPANGNYRWQITVTGSGDQTAINASGPTEAVVGVRVANAQGMQSFSSPFGFPSSPLSDGTLGTLNSKPGKRAHNRRSAHAANHELQNRQPLSWAATKENL